MRNILYVFSLGVTLFFLAMFFIFWSFDDPETWNMATLSALFALISIGSKYWLSREYEGVMEEEDGKQ